VPTFADRGVSHFQRGGTPTAVNLQFSRWKHYFFIKVAPHLSSWGWVDPVPDSPLLRKSGSAENGPRDFWSATRSSGH
jgi:hypothetical protein